METLLLELVLICLVLAGTGILLLLLLSAKRLADELFAAGRERHQQQMRRFLFQLLEEPPLQQHTSLATSSRMSRRRRTELMNACVQLSTRIKGRDLVLIQRIMEFFEFDLLAIALLKRGSPSQRYMATRALRIINHDDSLRALNRALHDRSPDVSISAAHALLSQRRKFDLDLVVELFAQRGLLQRQDCRQLFQRIGMQGPAPLVRLAKISHGDDQALAAAAYGMGFANDFSVIESLTRLAGNPSALVREQAMLAMARLEHPAAEPVILRGLYDPHWQVQLAAIAAAGETQMISTISHLGRLLENDNWLVRFNAGLSLKSLGREGLNALRARAGDSGRSGRIAQLMIEEASAADAGAGIHG